MKQLWIPTRKRLHVIGAPTTAKLYLTESILVPGYCWNPISILVGYRTSLVFTNKAKAMGWLKIHWKEKYEYDAVPLPKELESKSFKVVE